MCYLAIETSPSPKPPAPPPPPPSFLMNIGELMCAGKEREREGGRRQGQRETERIAKEEREGVG